MKTDEKKQALVDKLHAIFSNPISRKKRNLEVWLYDADCTGIFCPGVYNLHIGIDPEPIPDPNSDDIKYIESLLRKNKKELKSIQSLYIFYYEREDAYFLEDTFVYSEKADG